MKNKLKNWWFAILGFAMIILDQGFEALNPILNEMGIPSKFIWMIKLFFGLYAIYKLKLEMPTKNPEKLQKIVEGPGGSNPPPEKDDK